MKNLLAKLRSANLTTLFTLLIIFIAGEASVMYASQAPTGYSGASTSNCRSCHSSYALNNAGGSVVITGLPASYNAGQAYPISAVITHSTADRKKFGFSLKVVNSAGTAIGTLSTTNSYAAVSGAELVSKNPPALASTNTYTFNNLTWTAPVTPGTNDQSIKFYVCGNAANNNGSESNDYIYTSSVTVPLTVTGIEDITVNKDAVEILGNPARGNLSLQYSVASICDVSFSLISTDGKIIRIQRASTVTPGKHQFEIDANGIAPGIYFLRFTAGKNSYSKRIMIGQ